MANKKYFFAFIIGLVVVPVIFGMENPFKSKKKQGTTSSENNGAKKIVTPDELRQILVQQALVGKNQSNQPNNTNTQKVNS